MYTVRKNAKSAQINVCLKKKLYFLRNGHGCHRTRQFWPCAMICVFLVRWFSFSRVVKVNYMVKSPCMFCNSKPAVESLCFLRIFTRERYFNNIKKNLLNFWSISVQKCFNLVKSSIFCTPLKWITTAYSRSRKVEVVTSNRCSQSFTCSSFGATDVLT